MEPVTLVRAEPGPRVVEALASLEREAFGEDCYTVWAASTFCTYGACYFIRVGERTVGHAFLSACWEAPEAAFLASFGLVPTARGRGVGRRALDLLVGALRERGFRSLTLTVDPENVVAVRLYERAGFRVLESVPGCYGAGRDRLVMGLSLE